MNRFRTKKKAKEAEGLVRVSTDSDGPPLAPVKSSKTFRRGKKIPEPEPKLEIDLATALPSSDDFRTSLFNEWSISTVLYAPRTGRPEIEDWEGE
jgi:hypothetical protein